MFHLFSTLITWLFLLPEESSIFLAWAIVPQWPLQPHLALPPLPLLQHYMPFRGFQTTCVPSSYRICPCCSLCPKHSLAFSIYSNVFIYLCYHNKNTTVCGGLNKSLFLIVLEARNSKIKVPAWLSSDKSPLWHHLNQITSQRLHLYTGG